MPTRPDVPAQAQAWLHALTPGVHARAQLAQALVAGADPLSTGAIVGARGTRSVSLAQAVIHAAGALGAGEAQARLALLRRHAQAPSHADGRQAVADVVLAVLEAGMDTGLARTWWVLLAPAAAPETQRVLEAGLGLALATGQAWGAGVVAWLGREVAGVECWSDQDVLALEAHADPMLRDAYWALRREPGSWLALTPGRPACM